MPAARTQSDAHSWIAGLDPTCDGASMPFPELEDCAFRQGWRLCRHPPLQRYRGCNDEKAKRIVQDVGDERDGKVPAWRQVKPSDGRRGVPCGERDFTPSKTLLNARRCDHVPEAGSAHGVWAV